MAGKKKTTKRAQTPEKHQPAQLTTGASEHPGEVTLTGRGHPARPAYRTVLWPRRLKLRTFHAGFILAFFTSYLLSCVQSVFFRTI